MNTQFLSEDAVDRHILRVVLYHKGSDTYLKIAAIAASPIVGTYSAGTAKIAKEARRSVSTVENWAHAHWLYRELRSNGSRLVARKLWRELPASHWWLAYDFHAAGYDALHYLEQAAGNGLSSRDMVGNFKADRDAGIAPLVFHRAKHALYGLATELLDKQLKNLNKKQRAALEAVREAFE